MPSLIVGPPDTDMLLDFEMFNIHESVYSQCSRFSEVYGVEVTNRAQQIIIDLIDSFAHDPHPDWNADADMAKHQQFVVAYIDALPRYLEQIHFSTIGVRSSATTLTAFDIQLWVSRNINAICVYVCPF